LTGKFGKTGLGRTRPICFSEGRDCQVRSEGRACRVRLEGPACRVRDMALDYPYRYTGHDKHAPPIFRVEGPACQVCCTTLNYRFRYTGHDKHAPPEGGLELDRADDGKPTDR